MYITKKDIPIPFSSSWAGSILSGGSRTGAVRITGGSGGLSSSMLFCVCVLLLTVMAKVGGGGGLI
jgi:hypothetical protein